MVVLLEPGVTVAAAGAVTTLRPLLQKMIAGVRAGVKDGSKPRRRRRKSKK
jgi:hypothetical protein